MEEQKKILVVRFAYWLGAILDGLTFLMMVFPSVGAGIFSSDSISYGASYQYANALGAPLMIGWTVLLIWADRKPIERRTILLITIFPVMTLLITANIVLFLNGITVMDDFLPRFLIQVFVVVVFTFAYLLSNDVVEP